MMVDMQVRFWLNVMQVWDVSRDDEWEGAACVEMLSIPQRHFETVLPPGFLEWLVICWQAVALSYHFSELGWGC